MLGRDFKDGPQEDMRLNDPEVLSNRIKGDCSTVKLLLVAEEG